MKNTNFDTATLFGTELSHGDFLIVGLTNPLHDSGRYHCAQLLSADMQIKANSRFALKPYFPERPKLLKNGEDIQQNFFKHWDGLGINKGVYQFDFETGDFEKILDKEFIHSIYAAVAVTFTIETPIRVGAPKEHTELVLNGVVCKEGYSIAIPKSCYTGSSVMQSCIKNEQGESLIHINFDEGRPQAGMGLGYVVDGVPYAYPHNAKKDAIKFCQYQDKGKTLVFNKIEAVFKVK